MSWNPTNPPWHYLSSGINLEYFSCPLLIGTPTGWRLSPVRHWTTSRFLATCPSAWRDTPRDVSAPLRIPATHYVQELLSRLKRNQQKLPTPKKKKHILTYPSSAAQPTKQKQVITYEAEDTRPSSRQLQSYKTLFFSLKFLLTNKKEGFFLWQASTLQPHGVTPPAKWIPRDRCAKPAKYQGLDGVENTWRWTLLRLMATQ